MLTLRQSPFHLLRSDLLDANLIQTLERQLNAAERLNAAEGAKGEAVPAAEVHEGPDCYTITLDLPGVDKASIDVKATDRSLVVGAERRRTDAADAESASAPTPLLSEIHYGSWSRSFRFPGGINREGLSAHYRDGVLTITAPKAHTLTSVQVQLED